MGSTDDISTRVLLRKVLHTELPRTPVTRSASTVRRSMRMKNTAVDSPGSALRNRLKKKLHESASVSPLPSPKRRRSAGVKPDPPIAAPSPMFDEDMTTRGLLRGIIQMETETSLLMSGQPAVQEPEANPAESSVSSAGERTEGLSGVELSDLTLNTEPLTHVVRGLSRRKPQHAFNVLAFEKQLDQLPDTEDVSHVSHGGDVPQEESNASQDLDFSAGSKSGLNLTLKTPFVERHTERAGLQRKVSNRRLPSVNAFDEAVQRCLEQGTNQDHSEVLDGKTLEDSSWQKFTLGLNDVTELYIQMKKDDTMGPSAESERENQEKVSEIPDVLYSEHLIQEQKDHEMEPLSQEGEEVVHSSQEAGDLFLSTEYDIVLAPTQAMTDLRDENLLEVAHEEVVGDVEHVIEIGDVSNEEVEGENAEENSDASNYQEQMTRRTHRSEGGGAVLRIPAATRVTKSFGPGLNPREKGEDVVEMEDEIEENAEENPDALHYQEQMTRRAHRSEGGGAVLRIPAATRVTKSFGAGLNPREKGEVVEDIEHLVEFKDEGHKEIKDENAEENPDRSHYQEQIARRAHRSEGGSAVLRNPTTTRVTKSFGAGLNPREKDLLDLADGSRESLQDVPDEEIEELGSPAAEVTTTQQREASQAEDAPESADHYVPEEVSQTEEEMVESETANQSREPLQEEEVDEEMVDTETADQSPEPLQEDEEEDEDIMDSVQASQSPEPPLEEEEQEEMMDSVPANQSPEPLEEEEEEEDDDALSAELSMKTPAFVRQKRVFSSPTAQAVPTVLKEVNAGPAPQGTKRAPRQKRQAGTDVLPKSYVMSIFKHFAKTKVASDVYPAINEILKKYYERLADDLEAYATHAKRKTIELEDFELLMRRQGFVTDSMPVNILIEKYLPLEYRKLLIPVATSGNKVIPTQRR